MPSVEELSITTIRTLAMDAVQKANSGHPGTAMALAPVAYLLYEEQMRHDPGDPHWPNRDRFVLSAGHACILQYAALHLAGYDLSIDDLKAFRQWESKTPGHPEMHHTPGVETTTGPLGQGVGNAVGMALAERDAGGALQPPRARASSTTTRTASARDGDLHGGRLAARRRRIAGHLGLGSLTCFYDDNHITIEGDTALSFTEDVGRALRGYGWHVQRYDDTWTLDTLREAIVEAHADPRPSMIILPHAHRATARRTSRTPRERPRRAARRRRDPPHEAAPTAGRRTRTSSCPTRCAEHCDRRGARARRSRRLGRRVRGLPRARTPTWRPSSSARRPARCPTTGPTHCPAFTPDDGAIGDARGRRQGAAGPRRARSPSWSAARPTSRRPPAR